jgi:hypothetical protein
MKQKKTLPEWCQILDGLNSEIAEESTQNIEGHREMHNRKTRLEDKGGVDASLEATTSAHATAVSTIPRKEVPTIE